MLNRNKRGIALDLKSARGREVFLRLVRKADIVIENYRRDTMDKLKDKLKSAAIVLATVDSGGKVQLAAGVTSDRIAKLKAGELVNFVAQQVGGKGGGKPDLAMAGGTEPGKLAQALASVPGWVGERA